MINRSSARHYAKALFELTTDDRQRGQLLQDIDRVVELNYDSTIAYYLSDPRISTAQKCQRITEMLGVNDTLLYRLVGVLISKHQMSLLAYITNDFQRLLDASRGIERAQVTSAVPLNEDTREIIGQRLSRLIGKDIVVEFSISPGLIGGLLVRVGDKLLDGSTRTTLDSLRKTISA